MYVWDPRATHRVKLAQTIAACDARAEYLSSASLAGILPLRGMLALVVMEPDGPTDPLGVIRFFKHRQLEILAITPDAQSMSLTERCHALLAGATALIDSRSDDFAIRLREGVLRSLQAQHLRGKELEHVRGAMRAMHIIGDSESLLDAFRTLLKVSALSDVPVLISGESGTGKELFAHALQQLDPKRSRGPFVSVNCAAISSHLVESELFGHRRGSFTGAEHHRKGLVRSADGGTLLLDEVGELEIGLQAKMLRVLQEKRVLAVGEDAEVPVDIRVIAATNRPLDQMVRAKTFREDLYHRLNVVNIRIPPLRERTEDIRLLVEHFVRKHSNLASVDRVAVAFDFVNALSQLELRGNARELENIVRQVLLNKAEGEELTLLDLPREVMRSIVAVESVEDQSSVPTARELDHGADDTSQELRVFQNLLASGASLSTSLRRCEKILLQAALLRARGNQSQTARLLGITPRSVYNKLRRHNLAA